MISIKNGELVTLTQKKRHIIVTVNKEKPVLSQTPESVDFINDCTYLHALIYKAKTTPRPPLFICEYEQALSPFYHLRLPVGRRRKKIRFLPSNPLQKGSFGYIISMSHESLGVLQIRPLNRRIGKRAAVARAALKTSKKIKCRKQFCRQHSFGICRLTDNRGSSPLFTSRQASGVRQ